MKPWIINPTDRFLILSPHPDDESIGCGGLLLKYPKQCDVVLLTDGRHGDPALRPSKVKEIRKFEFIHAMNMAGIDSLCYLDVEDGRLSKSYKIFKKRMPPLASYDYVLIPHSDDYHPDHACVHRHLRRLTRFLLKKPKIMLFEIWNPMPKPNFFLDITDVMNKKRALIELYESQTKFINYSSRITGLNHFRGITLHIEYVECYTKAR